MAIGRSIGMYIYIVYYSAGRAEAALHGIGSCISESEIAQRLQNNGATSLRILNSAWTWYH